MVGKLASLYVDPGWGTGVVEQDRRGELFEAKSCCIIFSMEDD